MKPRVVMHRLKIMDSNYKVLDSVGPYPAVEVKDIVFIRVPDSSVSGCKEEFMKSISNAAYTNQKTFVILPPDAELVEVTETWEVLNDTTKGIKFRQDKAQ